MNLIPSFPVKTTQTPSYSCHCCTYTIFESSKSTACRRTCLALVASNWPSPVPVSALTEWQILDNCGKFTLLSTSHKIACVALCFKNYVLIFSEFFFIHQQLEYAQALPVHASPPFDERCHCTTHSWCCQVPPTWFVELRCNPEKSNQRSTSRYKRVLGKHPTYQTM